MCSILPVSADSGCQYVTCLQQQDLCGAKCFSGPQVCQHFKHLSRSSCNGVPCRCAVMVFFRGVLSWCLLEVCCHSVSWMWCLLQVCCDGVLHQTRPGYECCNTSYVQGRSDPGDLCCGGAFYTALDNHQCCSGRSEPLTHTKPISSADFPKVLFSCHKANAATYK